MAGNRSTLIVASDQYSDAKLSRLRSPSTDAAELARVLGDPAIGNFSVALSMNETEARVRRRLSSFVTSAGREDLLLLHVACHGVKDDEGNLYFATTDTETAALLATAVSADFVRQLLDRTLSRRIVVLLDCCYSGAFARGTRGDPDVHVLERFQPDRFQQRDGRGRAVLTASSAMEYAWEGDDIKGEGLPSVFTGAVVRGLETGEADRDGDGHISVDDLYDYVLEKVREATPKQTPNKLIQLEGGLIIAESVRGPRARSGALLPELLETIKDPRPWVREGGVSELGRLLQGPDARLTRAAEAALTDLTEDDSRRVSDAARKMLSVAAEARLAALYADAQARYQAGAWQETLDVLGRIRAVDPSYPGLDELEAAARRQLAAAVREQTLAALYDRALKHLEAKQWTEAIAAFQQLQGEQPGYRDAEARLLQAQEGLEWEDHERQERARQEEAHRQARLAQLYGAARQAYEARAWPQAIEHLEAVVALDPQYRDAAALLEEAGRQQKLAELYAEARELHYAQAWQGVLNILQRMGALDAGYEDSEGLESTAREALASEQRQRDYEALFSRGLAHLESGEWPAAIEVVEQLQREYPEQPDSEALLAQARERLAQQEEGKRQERAHQEEEARKRRVVDLYATAERAYEAGTWSEAIQHLEGLLAIDASDRQAGALLEQARRQQRLAELYAEARRLHAAGDWQAVVEVFEHVRALDAGYADPDGLLPSACERLAAAEQDAKLAALFDQGVRHAQREEWGKAAEALEEVHRLEPGYRDVSLRLNGAQIQLAKQAERERAARLDADRRQQAEASPRRTSADDAVQHTESQPTQSELSTQPAWSPPGEQPASQKPPFQLEGEGQIREPANRPRWPIPLFVAGMVGVLALWLWAITQGAPLQPNALPESFSATVAPIANKPTAAASPLVVATLGIPSDWPRKVAGFDWANTTPVTDSQLVLVNRHLQNGVLTWLATAKSGVLLFDWDKEVQLGENFVITSSIRQVVGNNYSAYGIVFRASSFDNLYEAAIYDMDFAILARRKDSKYEILKSNIVANIDAAGVNTIIIKGTNNHYALQVNDRIILEADDDQLTGGSPGVIAELGNPADNGTWEFSRFEVYSPQ